MKNSQGDHYEEGLKKVGDVYTDVREAAEHLYEHTKDKAHEYLQEGKHKVRQTQENIEDLTDELITKVKAKPLTSLLIAAGIGFIIASLTRSK